MQNILKNTKLKNFFEYLIAIAVILNTRSLYLHIANNADNKFTLVVFLILIIGVLGSTACEGKIPVNRLNSAFVMVFLLIIYLGFYILVRPYDLLADVFYLLSACILLFYYYICCSNNSLPDVLLKYRNVMCFLAIYSIIMWLICTKFNLIQPSGKLYSTWADNYVNNYYWIYFETQAQRNTAIFTEAPMSSLHFSVALAIEFFLSKEISRKRALIFILAILTTSSVTGYIFLCLTLGIKFICFKPRKKIFIELKFITIPILFICICLVGYHLIMQRIGTRSGIVRINDFINCFNVWSKNLLFGVGGGDVADGLLSGSSNSLGRLLAERGLYLGILYIYCFYKSLKNSLISKNINRFLFVLLFIYLFIFTIIPYTYLTMFLLIFFVRYKPIRNTDKIRINKSFNLLPKITN